MNEGLEKIKVFVKEHWAIVVGGAVGLYVILHYMGGSASASTSTDSTAAIAGADAATAAANNQYALASQQLSAQTAAATQSAEVGQTTAIGNAIGNIGQTITGIIAAQSIIPASAINAASVNNQTALVSAATVANSGMSNLANILGAGAQQLTASYTPLAIVGQSLIGLNDHIGSLGEAAVNAVGQSVSSSAGSAAQSAAASAQANAAASTAAAGAISSTAKVAMA